MTTKRIAGLVLGAIAIVLLLNLVAAALDDAVGGSQPGGQPGSSFATSPEGLAAYVDLLADFDHRVERLRGNLADHVVTSEQTLVVVDPGPLSAEDVDMIEQSLDAGARVVLVGASTSDARKLFDGAPLLTGGTTAYETIDPAFGGIATVTSNGDYAFDGAGAMTPLVSEGDLVLAASAGVGDGELVLVADSSSLGNGLLGDSDNAAFALEIVGEGRDVLFAEGVHGVDTSQGLGALPTGWKYALGGFAAGGVLFAWAHARRLGPPDRPERTLPPARGEYVAALAESLERTRQPAGALDELARTARERAAIDLINLPDNDLLTLDTPPSTAHDVLALGKVSARVARGEIEETTAP